MSSASSHDASRKWVNGLAGSTWSLESFFAFGRPHQWLGQAMGMMDVVKSKPPLDAEPVVIGRAVAAFGVDDLLVLHFIGDLTADAAERAQLSATFRSA